LRELAVVQDHSPVGEKPENWEARKLAQQKPVPLGKHFSRPSIVGFRDATVIA
jgi:hypothetical protein